MLRRFFARFVNLFRRRRAEREFDRELGAHLRLLQEELEQRGMTGEQARREAQLKLGGVEQARELYREARTLRWLETLWQDVGFAARILRKNSGFTTVAVLTLALGIGANTAIFSLIDAVILRMLPVEQPQGLTELQVEAHSEYGLYTSFSYPQFERFRDANHVFSGMLTVSNTSLAMTSKGETQATTGQYVSGNFFSLLGVPATIGRTIIPADDTNSSGGNPSVVVLSFALWQQRFGGDPAVVGRQVEVEGSRFTIIGVAAPGFFGLQVGRPQGFWIPISAEPLLRSPSWLTQDSYHWLSVVGRFKPGVTAVQAQADLQVILAEVLRETAPAGNTPQRELYLAQTIQLASAGNGLSRLRRQFSKPLLIVMILVGAVLLIACANVASLLLARGTSRRKEVSVRLALGASRWRLIRQFLTESIMLAALGGTAGLGLAYFASAFLVTFMSSTPTPLVVDLRPDVRVLAFTMLISLLTGILFGLAPAFRATRVDAAPDLKDRAGMGSHAGIRLGRSLVVSQISLSLLLLVGAGLFVGTLRKLKTFDPGFVSENVLLANVNPAKAGYKGPQLTSFYLQLLDRIRQQRGVVSASLSMVTPVAGGGVELTVSVQGYAPSPNEDKTVYVNRVSPGYFATVHTRLITGRDFTTEDRDVSPKVALVNQEMVRYYFHDRIPLGAHVTLGTGKFAQTYEIVGVVKDSKYLNLREPIHRTVFTDCFQSSPMPESLNVEVKTFGNPASFVSVLSGDVKSISGGVPFTGLSTLDQQVDRSITQERLVATVSGFFGALAVLLACVGLYGLMSYNVANRTSEIGIRMALGARRGGVVWMMMREALLLSAAGIATGASLSVVVARLAASEISSMLFGISATSINVVAVASVGLISSAVLASCLPAWRASRVDPMVALRHE